MAVGHCSRRCRPTIILGLVIACAVTVHGITSNTQAKPDGTGSPGSSVLSQDMPQAGPLPKPTLRGAGERSREAEIMNNAQHAYELLGNANTRRANNDNSVTAEQVVPSGDAVTQVMVPLDKCKLPQYPGMDAYLNQDLNYNSGQSTVDFVLCGTGYNGTCGALNNDIGVCFTPNNQPDNAEPYGLESSISVQDYYGKGLVYQYNTGSSGRAAFIYVECYNLVTGVQWTSLDTGPNNNLLFVTGQGSAGCAVNDPTPSPPLPAVCSSPPAGFGNAGSLNGRYSASGLQNNDFSLDFDWGLCDPLFEPCNNVPFGVGVCGYANSPASSNAVSYGQTKSITIENYYNLGLLYQMSAGTAANMNYAALFVSCDAAAGTPISWKNGGNGGQGNAYMYAQGTSSAACPTAGFKPTPPPNGCDQPDFPNMNQMVGPWTVNGISNSARYSVALCQGLELVCGMTAAGQPGINVGVCQVADSMGQQTTAIWGEVAKLSVEPYPNKQGIVYRYTALSGQRTTIVNITCDPGNTDVDFDNAQVDNNLMTITGQSGYACPGPPRSPAPPTPSPSHSPVGPKPSPTPQPSNSPVASPVASNSPAVSPTVNGTLPSPKPSNKKLALGIGLTSGMIIVIGVGIICAYGWNRRRRLRREQAGEIEGDPYEHPLLWASESTSLLGSVPNITWGSVNGAPASPVGYQPAVVPNRPAPPTTGATTSVSLHFHTDPKLGIPEFHFSQVEPFLTNSNRIARGGFGEVFVFEHHGHAIALKRAFVDMDDISYAHRVKEAFTTECRLLFQLRHQNVLKIYAASLNLPNLCFISEYMERNSLYKVLKNHSIELDLERRLDIATQVATGMQFLHSQRPQILHRDLKSLNILIGKKWNVKIADFGLARSCQNSHLSTQHQHAGSPAWMAPELLRDQPESVNTKVDVYAFGVVLWELMARVTPWEGEPHHAIIRRVGLQGERLSLDPVRRAISIFGVAGQLICDDYVSLVNDCFAEDSAARPDFAHIRERLANLREMFTT